MLSKRTSPTSATLQSSYGFFLVTGWNLRMLLDWLRISRGPWRVPGRLLTPASVGTPTNPMSRPSSDFATGARMKVGSSMKRGSSIGSLSLPVTGERRL